MREPGFDPPDNMPPEPPPIEEQFPSAPPRRREQNFAQRDDGPPRQRQPEVVAVVPANRAPQHMQRPQQGVPQANRQPGTAMDQHGNWLMRNEHEEFAVIARLRKAQAIPKTYINDEQVAYALQVLRSKGHNPLASIGDTGFINGKYTEYNDLPLATAQKSGELEHFDEFVYTMGEDNTYKRACFANNNLHLEPAGAVCIMQRKGQEPREFYYTRDQAKVAGQYGKAGPWKTDFPGMLKYKARSRALRSVFADALSGGGDTDE